MNVKITEETEALPVIIGFIRSLGIDVHEGAIHASTFLPGVDIRQGGIVYDPTAEFYPGDLLHEAGHLALLQPEKREALSGNVADTFPEDHGSEIAVMLWTYLAARHLNIDPAVVFHANGYKEQNDWISSEFEHGRYMGLPLLEWMGVVRIGEDGHPEVVSWLRQ